MLLNVAVVCLRNAATGAAPGAITVELSRCDAGACPAGAVDVSVCFVAAGRVLSPAEIGAAFEPYSSHDGLALKVARFFAHAMCGDLCFVLGDGCTRFELRVRLHVPGGPPPEPHDTPPPRAVAATAAQASAASTAPPPVGVALTQQMLEHLMRYSDELFHSGDFRPDGALFVCTLTVYQCACIDGIDTLAWARQDFVSPSVEQYGLGLTCADFVGAAACSSLLWWPSGFRMTCSRAAGVRRQARTRPTNAIPTTWRAGVPPSATRWRAPTPPAEPRRPFQSRGALSFLTTSGSTCTPLAASWCAHSPATRMHARDCCCVTCSHAHGAGHALAPGVQDAA